MAAAPPLAGPGGGLGGGGLGTFGSWQTAFFIPHRRSIGGIVAQVTISEQASDDIQITEHPVEQGAPIADHAFKRPAVVTITAGWTRQYAWDLSAETGMYGLLLSWQAALLPFDVITGKRSYTNMLIERLQVMTDNHSEYALMATITCRQVIIVSTATTNVPGMSSSGNDQTNPSQTAPTQNGGTKSSNQAGTVDDSQLAPNSIQQPPPDDSGQPSGAPAPPQYDDNPSTPTAAQAQAQFDDDQVQLPNSPPVQTPTTNPYTGNEAGKVIPIPPAPPHIISP